MDSCEWKMTYNNPNHCSMMELAHSPSRPPWRPAASSITAFKDSDGPAAPRSSFRFRHRSTELAVPPQYMSVTDLIAAMPKRLRMPKPQTLCTSYGLAMEPTYSAENRMTLKTPWAAPVSDSLSEHLEAHKRPEMQSLEQTPKSVLEQAARSVASSRSRQSAAHGSQLASPPSTARSLASSRAPSVAPSERHHSVASRHSAIASPAIPLSQPTSTRRRGASGSDRASPASGARSLACSPAHSRSSAQTISRTPGTPPSELVSANDQSSSHGSTNARQSRSRSSRFNNTRGSSCSLRMNTTDTNSNKDFPSRGTTGGSTPRSRSSCVSGNSTPSHRSMCDGSPAMSGRCSPPTPPNPLSP